MREGKNEKKKIHFTFHQNTSDCYRQEIHFFEVNDYEGKEMVGWISDVVDKAQFGLFLRFYERF